MNLDPRVRLDRSLEVATVLEYSRRKPDRKRGLEMLPPFIIDQIRRREEDVQRRQELDRPRLELPVDVYHPAPEPKPTEDDVERGVIILDLG